MTVFGVALAVSFVLGSFILWRKLKSEYDGEQLLTLWLWLVVVAWLGSGLWVWWSWQWRQIWGAVALPMLVLLWWSHKYHWHFWELVDSFGPVSLGVCILAASGWGPRGWLVALTATIGVILSVIVGRLYRRWQWYKSGRMGVVGIGSLAWWAVVNLVIANFHQWAVYSLAWVIAMAVVAIYLRSGRQLNWVWLSLKKQPKQ